MRFNPKDSESTIKLLQTELSKKNTEIEKLKEEVEKLKKKPSTTVLDAYPVGSTYITRTNTNPKAWLGGEWELYDKKFKNLLKAATVTRNDSSSFGASINLSDSVVSGYVNFTPSKAMNDTTLKVGQINLSSIGLTALGTSRITAWTDAGNACVLVTLESDGVLNVNDVIGQSTVASGNAVYFSFSKVCVMSNMLDSYCDRFYWRRTEQGIYAPL